METISSSLLSSLRRSIVTDNKLDLTGARLPLNPDGLRPKIKSLSFSVNPELYSSLPQPSCACHKWTKLKRPSDGAAISERQQQFEEITRSQSPATTQPSVHQGRGVTFHERLADPSFPESAELLPIAQCGRQEPAFQTPRARTAPAFTPPITSTMGSNVATTSSMPDRNTGGSTRLPPPPPPSGAGAGTNIPSGPEHQLQCFKLGFQPQAQTNTKGRMLILQLSALTSLGA
ncbi:hypothetical protein Bca4012_004920 [Brassica carinata]